MSNQPRLFEKAVMHSSNKTQFNSTFFEIYERSVDESSCERLIIVQPFQWHIWAINGSVYLLNESNKSCPINYTPAIVVPKNQDNQIFKDVCINKVFNQIVTSYTDQLQPVVVQFDIKELQAEESKFTILDALNFLFKDHLTMTNDSREQKGMINLNRINNLPLRIHTDFQHDTPANYVTETKIRNVLQKSKINKKAQHLM